MKQGCGHGDQTGEQLLQRSRRAKIAQLKPSEYETNSPRIMLPKAETQK